MLDVPDIFGIDDHSDLFMLNILNQKDIQIFDSKAVQYYIKFKWDQYARNIFYFRFISYFFVMLMLIVYSVWLLPIRLRYIEDINRLVDYSRYGLINFIFNCILGFFAWVFAISEYNKMIFYGFKYYLSNFENTYFFMNVNLFLLQ